MKPFRAKSPPRPPRKTASHRRVHGEVPFATALEIATELCARGEWAEMMALQHALLSRRSMPSSTEAEVACGFLWYGFDQSGDAAGKAAQVKTFLQGENARLRAQAWVYLSRQANLAGDLSRSSELLAHAQRDDPENFLLLFDEIHLLKAAGRHREAKTRATDRLAALEAAGQPEAADATKAIRRCCHGVNSRPVSITGGLTLERIIRQKDLHPFLELCHSRRPGQRVARGEILYRTHKRDVGQVVGQ